MFARSNAFCTLNNVCVVIKAQKRFAFIDEQDIVVKGVICAREHFSQRIFNRGCDRDSGFVGAKDAFQSVCAPRAQIRTVHLTTH